MGRYLKVFAAVTALSAAVAFAPTAAAHSSVSVAIGAPGFAVGYSNYGYGGYVDYGAPYYAPYSSYYYAPAPYYGPYYGPNVAFYGYYGPHYYHHHHYYRHW